MRLERGDEAIEGGARVCGHTPTLSGYDAKWTGNWSQFERCCVSQPAPPTVTRARKFINGKEYELRIVTIEPNYTRQEAKQLLTDEPEYRRWALAHARLYLRGKRKVGARPRPPRVQPP